VNNDIKKMLNRLNETYAETNASGAGWYPLENGVYDGILQQVRIEERNTEKSGDFLNFTFIITVFGAGMDYDGKQIGWTENTIGHPSKKDPNKAMYWGIANLKGMASLLNGGVEPSDMASCAAILEAAATGSGTPVRFEAKKYFNKNKNEWQPGFRLLSVLEEEPEPTAAITG
jgi:hypothetical protein